MLKDRKNVRFEKNCNLIMEMVGGSESGKCWIRCKHSAMAFNWAPITKTFKAVTFGLFE